MRTTLNLEDDALLVAKRYASREKLSLGEAVSRLVRQGAQRPADTAPRAKLRGRFALLPARGEIITAAHVLDHEFSRSRHHARRGSRREGAAFDGAMKQRAR